MIENSEPSLKNEADPRKPLSSPLLTVTQTIEDSKKAEEEINMEKSLVKVKVESPPIKEKSVVKSPSESSPKEKVIGIGLSSPINKKRISSSPVSKRTNSPVTGGGSGVNANLSGVRFPTAGEMQAQLQLYNGGVLEFGSGSGPGGGSTGFGLIQSAAAARAAWLLLTNGASPMSPPGGYPGSANSANQQGHHFLPPGTGGYLHHGGSAPQLPHFGGNTAYWRM